MAKKTDEKKVKYYHNTGTLTDEDMFKKLAEAIQRRPIIGWGIFAVVMVCVFALGLLAASITERRAEIATLFGNKKIEITGINPHSEQWGVNYPREYDTWKKTANMEFRSKHMGSAVDDVLESRPEMVVLWAGYAFSRDYSAPRGHMHAIDDVRSTLRTGTPDEEGSGEMQPGTCWTCKGPDVPRLINEKGIDNFYKARWSQWGAEVTNPVGCADCHDPQTMDLLITRPALIEAYQRQGKNIEKATPQELRSLVCAQCHVEYHFRSDDKYLVFPWDGGMSVEQVEEFYDNIEFTDWTHALSKAPMLKAQHPDYEIYMTGPHAQRGLACADCHMPYVADGGIKYSNHQVMSPLANITNTCQVCHRESEDQLRNYVYEYQDKALEIRDRVETELSKAHIMAKIAWEKGANESQMKSSLQLLRQAQWRWDYAAASHGASFHAPVETQRIYAHGLDRTMQAQIELQRVLFSFGITDIQMPDISTKELAQAYIGLDMKDLRDKKAKWADKTIPQWVERAKANSGNN